MFFLFTITTRIASEYTKFMNKKKSQNIIIMMYWVGRPRPTRYRLFHWLCSLCRVCASAGGTLNAPMKGRRRKRKCLSNYGHHRALVMYWVRVRWTTLTVYYNETANNANAASSVNKIYTARALSVIWINVSVRFRDWYETIDYFSLVWRASTVIFRYDGICIQLG